MSLQRHTQKLFTSLSCVLLSLVLSLVIAFQKQTDLPQKQTAKQSGFFLKISKEIGKAWCKSLSASLQTFSLTARAYLNTQKIRTVLQSTTEKEQIDFTSDLTFNDYITWFESVEVVFRKLECWNFLWHLLAVYGRKKAFARKTWCFQQFWVRSRASNCMASSVGISHSRNSRKNGYKHWVQRFAGLFGWTSVSYDWSMV